MKVGVNILNFGPGSSPDALLRWAQVSEALGYHSIMISDHVAITPSVAQRYPEPYWDVFASLAWLAGKTERVQLGTTVVVLPYRHPVLTARLVSNIDHFSGGRFVLGIGVGNAQDEFEVMGASHAHRGTVADETLQAMIALWRGDGPVSYHGRYVNFDNVSAIKTAQTPHPPIWVGGNTEAAFRRCARYGDAWHPIIWRNLTIDWAGETIQLIRRQANELGRSAPKFCPRIRLTLEDSDVTTDRQPGWGSLSQVHEDLKRLEALGAEHVTLDWFTGDLEATRDHAHGWQMLATLADKVLDLPGERVR
jgi:probable F420-dependent oxidoreductase